MSMNLNARTKKGIVNLWQTPSQITYTIMPRSMGSEYKGKKAREAMVRYCEWVRCSLDGRPFTEGQYEVAKRNIDLHLAYIKQHLDEITEVWVM